MQPLAGAALHGQRQHPAGTVVVDEPRAGLLLRLGPEEDGHRLLALPEEAVEGVDAVAGRHPQTVAHGDPGGPRAGGIGLLGEHVDEALVAPQEALRLGERRGDGEEGLAHRVDQPDAVARPRLPRRLRDDLPVPDDDQPVRLVALTLPATSHPEQGVGRHALLLRSAPRQGNHRVRRAGAVVSDGRPALRSRRPPPGQPPRWLARHPTRTVRWPRARRRGGGPRRAPWG